MGRIKRQQSSPRVLTCPDVAALLNVSEARVYELARMRLLPSVRLGRSVRFLETEVLDWLAEGGAKFPEHDDYHGG